MLWKILSWFQLDIFEAPAAPVQMAVLVMVFLLIGAGIPLYAVPAYQTALGGGATFVVCLHKALVAGELVALASFAIGCAVIFAFAGIRHGITRLRANHS